MEDAIIEILKKYWGHRAFRPMQMEIIQSVLQGKDTVALLPTGGGKSLCFQVPAMAMEGVCIVVSPLIALMRDQVESLKKKGIKAIAINSALTKREIDVALDNVVYGDVKFLYLSPERLKTDILLARLQKMKVNLLAIDEAHCISEWGHDFRPAYREIALIREMIPKVPVIALTATATDEVVSDIAEQLELKKPQIFKKSFTRANLIYVVQEESHKLSRLTNIVKKLGGSGVVYVSTRRETVRQSHLLRANGIPAMPYHGGMTYEERKNAQELWIGNKAQVIVATNAFGMGIDKADVRFVVHLNLPQSTEAYFQEAGRAGRDGNLAYAIYLKSDDDEANLKERVRNSVPPETDILKVYRALVNWFQLALGSDLLEPVTFDVSAFAKRYGFNAYLTLHCLKALEYCGHITLSEAIHSPSRLQFILKGKDLYSFEVGHPKYERLIHIFLRSYEGLFEQPVRVNENNIGIKLKVAAAQVKDALKCLHEMRVLQYQEQTDLPFITFPLERKKAESLHLDREFLHEKRKRIFGKMDAILSYSNNSLLCRSRQLVAYFGERNSKNCGKCDVCLAMKNSNIGDEQAKKIRTEIEKELATGSTSLNKMHSFEKFRESEVLEVLRWMVDNELLTVGHNNLLAQPQNL